ncbi:hypothetical protein [Sphingomonas yantingensis]|uniref:Uncharacterized protein n=1 Tax=Sphingomonas yantingensis TaxID=1241761 RepID=A0A7W9EJ97_9SPHN|nr:hypothetical protein [Sphingomonas yantingensis]MBB5700018.1 hypothetical protein [Sphingomonas yantingensis]
MLGQMQRRTSAIVRDEQENGGGEGPGGGDPGNPPTYPVGRLNAVAVGQTGYIFRRDDGTRRATFPVPQGGGGNLPPENGRPPERTWFLYASGGTSYFTADYATAAYDFRIPTPAENPNNIHRRVYNKRIDSFLIEVRNGVVTNSIRTGTQTLLYGTETAIFPSPTDMGTRVSGDGHKVVNLLIANGQTMQGQAVPSGTAFGDLAAYPLITTTATVGSFTLSITSKDRSCGDTVVGQNGINTILLTNTGGSFFDIGRPVTEAEASVQTEVIF